MKRSPKMHDSQANLTIKKCDFEGWREWYSPVLDVIPENPTGDGFSCETRAWKLGSLTMSQTIGPPRARHIRTKNHIRRYPVDHWGIVYCGRDGYMATVRETEVKVPAGVPYLWSMGQEHWIERPIHGLRTNIFLPRDVLRDSAPLIDAACGSPLDTPLGRLLGDYMMALWGRLPDMTEAELTGLGKSVGAMMSPLLPHQRIRRPSPDR